MKKNPFNRQPREKQSETNRKQSRSRSRDKEHIKETKGSGRPAKRSLLLLPLNQENQESFSEQSKDQENSESNDKKLSLQVMDIFLNFFFQIGQDKGLVFNQNERAELKQKSSRDYQGNKIEWTPKHQWDPTNEAIKLKKVAALFDFDIEAKENKELYDLILEVSPIFAQQFTEEVYKMIMTIKMIQLGKQPKMNINLKLNCSQLTKTQNSDRMGELELIKQPIIQKKENEKGDNSMNDNLSTEVITLKLNNLSSIIRDNAKGNYFFLSFQFKKIKERANSNKANKQINRKAAYQKLVTQLYNILKRIQTKKE